jgi:hypothetical protein
VAAVLLLVAISSQPKRATLTSSGARGHVNFSKEDGANYLLQVAAASADKNYDGLRQHINPENIFLSDIGNLVASNVAGGFTRGFVNNGKLDYANDVTGYANRSAT